MDRSEMGKNKKNPVMKTQSAVSEELYMKGFQVPVCCIQCLYAGCRDLETKADLSVKAIKYHDTAFSPELRELDFLLRKLTRKCNEFKLVHTNDDNWTQMVDTGVDRQLNMQTDMDG